MRSSPDENIHTATSQTPSSVYPASNGNDSSHKRKRSGTDDAGRSSPQRQYDYSPPKRTNHPQHVADRALHVLGNSDDQRYYKSQNGIDHGDHAWSQGHGQPVQAPATNGAGDEDNSPGSTGQNYDSMNGSNSIVPKRKRNFSNRTKTGCMTCRRRKKKCDEIRPHCMCLPSPFRLVLTV